MNKIDFFEKEILIRLKHEQKYAEKEIKKFQKFPDGKLHESMCHFYLGWLHSMLYFETWYKLIVEALGGNNEQ
jgi:hypothetical protein